MNRIPVTSHNIYSIGYDSNSKVLEIEFDTYTVYRYYEVPEDVYDELMASESKGSYFFRKIKGGHNQSNSLYRYEQVE